MRFIVTRNIILALIYCDFSGLNESDIKAANKFDTEHGDKTIDILDDETTFERCELTGLYSDCVEIELTRF